jgi:hypothetical protein
MIAVSHNTADFPINVSIIVCADDDRQSPWCCRHGRTDRRNQEVDDSTLGEQCDTIHKYFILTRKFSLRSKKVHILLSILNYFNNNKNNVIIMTIMIRKLYKSEYQKNVR